MRWNRVQPRAMCDRSDTGGWPRRRTLADKTGSWWRCKRSIATKWSSTAAGRRPGPRPLRRFASSAGCWSTYSLHDNCNCYWAINTRKTNTGKRSIWRSVVIFFFKGKNEITWMEEMRRRLPTGAKFSMVSSQEDLRGAPFFNHV